MEEQEEETDAMEEIRKILEQAPFTFNHIRRNDISEIE